MMTWFCNDTLRWVIGEELIMNFKTDWSFLEKISMGAVGTQAVIDELNRHGHQVIELERYCTSNKIWSTKIKRLRMPDLICLKCGKRIESRAKSKLEVKMSDTDSNPDRRWNVGLRKEDLVAFINCYKGINGWETNGVVNLFSVDSMEIAENKSKLGAPKSPGEGSEKDRNWPCYVPKKDGFVEEIIDNSKKHQLRLKYDDGSTYTYSCKDKEHYCIEGERFFSDASILAGVLPKKERIECEEGPYDFIDDIKSNRHEIRYAGVKALGFLPRTDIGIKKLYDIVRNGDDVRIQLEAYASLIRLGEDVWEELKKYAYSIQDDAYKMEFVLILGELSGYENGIKMLYEIIDDESFFDEMRAAAVWGLKVSEKTMDKVLQCCFSDNNIISSHAIALLENNMKETYTDSIIRRIKDNNTGAICLHLLTNTKCVERNVIVNEFIQCDDELLKKWLFLIIGFSGREYYGNLIEKLVGDEQVKCQLGRIWDYKNYAMKQEHQNSIEFIKLQEINRNLDLLSD